MYNEYGMSMAARQRLVELRREAEEGRLVAACAKRVRRRKELGRPAPASALPRRRWRAGLGRLLGY